MKKLKTLILSGILVFQLAGCEKSRNCPKPQPEDTKSTTETTDEAPLKVCFMNKTGAELSNIEIGGKQLGALSNEAGTNFITYEVFHFDTGVADEAATASSGDRRLSDMRPLRWCGTEKYIRREGRYRFALHITSIDGVDYLELRCLQ